MSTIFFKFKSARDYDTCDIDGPFITLGRLKSKILLKKNLTKTDLSIQNAQTGKYYTNEFAKIPASTSVILKRIPLKKNQMKSSIDIESVERKEKKKLPGLSAPSIPGLGASKNVKSEVKTITEEEKLNQLTTKTTEYTPDDQISIQRMNSKPPAGYICHRCGSRDHYINDCPTNGNPNYNPKKSRIPVGIPRSFLQNVEEENADENALMLGDQMVVMKPNQAQFNKEKESVPNLDMLQNVPDHLVCKLCKSLYKDAIITPCCGVTFCNDCLTEKLVENLSCPACHQKNIQLKNLIPNRSIRELVDKFKKGKGFDDTKALTSQEQQKLLMEQMYQKKKLEMEERKKSNRSITYTAPDGFFDYHQKMDSYFTILHQATPPQHPGGISGQKRQRESNFEPNKRPRY